MALLYESIYESFAEPIMVNSFDTFFSSRSLLWGAKVSWVEKQCYVEWPRGDFPSISTYGGIPLLGLGTPNPGVRIPTGFPNLTYTLMFRIVEEERLLENRITDMFWYGQGYEYTGGWGETKMPLFRVWLNANDNHVYLWFGGGRQVEWGGGGWRSTYTFGEWLVDLGDAYQYKKYTNCTIWIDFDTKAFKKILVGTKTIPFPPGYTEIAPASFYQDALYGGMILGDIAGNRTNVKAYIDDIELYGEYHTPPTGLCPLQIGVVVTGLTSAALIPAGYTVYASKKRE